MFSVSLCIYLRLTCALLATTQITEIRRVPYVLAGLWVQEIVVHPLYRPDITKAEIVRIRVVGLRRFFNRSSRGEIRNLIHRETDSFERRQSTKWHKEGDCSATEERG